MYYVPAYNAYVPIVVGIWSYTEAINTVMQLRVLFSLTSDREIDFFSS
jgi:hypothetical protein